MVEKGNKKEENKIYDGQYVIPEKSAWEKFKNRFFGRRRKSKFMHLRAGKVYAVIGALLFGAFTGLCSYYNVFGSTDYLLSESIFKWVNHEDSEESKVRIITVDETTVKEYGKYEDWSRSRLAEILEKLEGSKYYKPLSVGILLDLNEEKTDGGDEKLVEVCKKYDNITAAVVRKRVSAAEAGDAEEAKETGISTKLSDTEAGEAEESSEVPPDVLDAPEIPAEEGVMPEMETGRESQMPAASPGAVARVRRNTMELPFEALRPYVTYGYITIANNPNAILEREFALNENVDGKRYDGFAIAVYKKYLEGLGENYVAPEANSQNVFSLNYLRDDEQYDTISFYDVMEGNINPKVFEDSIVLIADESTQTAERVRRNQMSVPKVQANVIDALIEQNTGQTVSKIFMASLYAVFIALFFFITAYSSGIHVLLEGVFLILFLVVNSAIMNVMGHYILILVPTVFLIVITILNLLNRYLILWKSRHQMETVLKKYVDKNIVNEIVSEGEIAVKIGGIKKDVAVLFVDIRGFTSLSESMDPENIVNILNRYLSLVSQAISKNQGTLDKFIGDAAMAVFNSPFDLKNYEYHAACAAWDIKESAAELNEMCEREYGKKVNFGIGIHCGEAVIGNIGSELRMDYTAIGDTVNTASRLEGSAEPGQILISEEMKQRLGNMVETSFVGNYTFKGKKNAMPVYSVTKIHAQEEEAEEIPAERIVI